MKYEKYIEYPMRTIKASRNESLYLPLFWPVRQSGAAVEPKLEFYKIM